MPNLTWKGISVSLDNAANTLTAITSSVNQAGLQSTMEALEDTSLADEERSYMPGLAGATVPLNGFWNGTTSTMLGPLLGNRTTTTKTFQYYDSLKYYNGEVYVTDLQLSGQVNTLQTFSATLTFDGPVNRTSVALS